MRYLFQRRGSRNWHIKLQSPDGRVERSLGTSDRREAELIALPMIEEHKRKLFKARPRFAPYWQRRLAPGLHTAPNGQKIFAGERELHYLDAEGRVAKVEPNGGLIMKPAPPHVQGMPPQEAIENFYRVDDAVRRTPPAKKTSDDQILETYLKHAGVTGRFESEARAVWSLFKTLCGGKALKDCDRDDGRKVAGYLFEKGLKSATVQKNVMWLNAAVNLAIKEGRLKFNPFSSVVPKRDDKQKRLPLDAADIKVCKARFGDLGPADQLLFRLLACTGMRLGEAFEITSEQKERGCRFVIVGHKTEASLRRVPLPAGVLPYLPKVITGPLFAGNAPSASKRLNRFMRDIGIVDPCKVVHSLRHRAQDRLRAAACPAEIRFELLGHEEVTVAGGYGEGSPLPMLKKWVDRIGF